MTATSSDVFLACHMAVRLSLQGAAKAIVNHRGRSERGRYRDVLAEDLYLALDPPAQPDELDRWEQTFTAWWGLPSVLDEAQIPHIQLYMRACAAYVRDCMLRQQEHQPDALRAYLAQVDHVTGAA